jgi:hypothetical protein
MPLQNTRYSVYVAGDLTTALDLATAITQLNLVRGQGLDSGTGANQADRIFHDNDTIAPSGTKDWDLAGVLLDPYGATITFARIKGIVIAAAAANINNLIVGNAAANGFLNWVGAATHVVNVRPGGIFALFAPDATAYAVTAATADILRITNSGAGTSVVYDIVLIGASA